MIEQTKHLGIDERILFEHKDWSKETEDVKDVLKDPFNSNVKAEQLLSVNE